ncbi:MAG: DUF547 domain-containing protein [Dehalococcoidia bacterium]
MTARVVTAALLLVALAAGPAAAQPAFDHAYAEWDSLLRRHVRWLDDGGQSRVDYDGFAADRTRLRGVLDALSAVPPAEFARWSRLQQVAFLINAYNAFTIELVLTAWPEVTSIRDLGSFLRSPWRQRFFTLLGESRHLDWIEHQQLRPRYGEPRLHVALNCASIGCPALRPEAFVAPRLDAQLDDAMRRFLGDRTRNRVAGGRLEVSAIFRWYRGDFERGDGGFRRLEDVFARYADALSDDPEERAALRAGRLRVTFLPYDWSLNAARR